MTLANRVISYPVENALDIVDMSLPVICASLPQMDNAHFTAEIHTTDTQTDSSQLQLFDNIEYVLNWQETLRNSSQQCSVKSSFSKS